VVLENDLPAVPDQLQLAGLEDAAVVVTEHGQEDGGGKTGRGGVPSDVEGRCKTRAGAAGEKIPPPAVAAAGDGHVVGDDIKDNAQTCACSGSYQPAPCRFPSQLGAHSGVIDDVIAMRRARCGLQEGREVEMADAQVLQIRYDGRSPVQTQIRPQLEPVGASYRSLSRCFCPGQPYTSDYSMSP
jgi:hypothetical protein